MFRLPAHCAVSSANWDREFCLWCACLSTSLCIVSEPGALPLLINLTKLMRVCRQHRPQAHVHFQCQNGSHLGPQEDKNIYDYSR